METIAQLIEREVLSWPGTTVRPHRFGGVEFRVNHHEIGHLHGNHQADLPFPVRIRKELVAAGKASLHHIVPDTGAVSYYIHGIQDVPGAIELFRLNYERLTAARPTKTIVGEEKGHIASQDVKPPSWGL